MMTAAAIAQGCPELAVQLMVLVDPPAAVLAPPATSFDEEILFQRWDCPAAGVYEAALPSIAMTESTRSVAPLAMLTVAVGPVEVEPAVATLAKGAN